MDYNLCLELTNSLETIKEHHLRNVPSVQMLAKFIQMYNITNLEFLNELVESLIASGSRDADESSVVLTPESILRSELISADLAPWAEKLRRRFFRKAEAPFTNYQSAVDWIKKYDVPMTSWKGSSRHSLEPFRTSLLFYERNGNDGHAFPRIGSPVEKIIFACHKLARKLGMGLDRDSLVFYVLAGIPPFIPPFEITYSSRPFRLPSGRRYECREANVKIREGFNLTYLQWMYELIRERLQLTKKKGFSALHLQLYRLVQRKGKIPQGKGTVSFWTSVMNEWNQSHPESEYKTWKGAKIAYERIITKLGAGTQSAVKASMDLENKSEGGN